MTHIFSPQSPNSCSILFSPPIYLRRFSHSQQGGGVLLLLGEQKNSWLPSAEKILDYFRKREQPGVIDWACCTPSRAFTCLRRYNFICFQRYTLCLFCQTNSEICPPGKLLHPSCHLHCRRWSQRMISAPPWVSRGVAIVAETPKTGGSESFDSMQCRGLHART